MKPKFDVEEMASRTGDAYSADGYTSWLACVRLLARLGYDEWQTEAILRSKWTRWARDSWDGRGTPTSNALRNFLVRNHYNPKHSDVAELVKETFGKNPPAKKTTPVLSPPPVDLHF
jgi:hypothetical protein